MIRRAGDCFVLTAPGMSYALRITETGHPEHLYFGPALGWDENTSDEALEADCLSLATRREFEAGNTISTRFVHS